MHTHSVFSLAPLMLLAACATPGPLKDTLGSAEVVTASGQPAGKTVIMADGERLSLSLSLTGLPAGEHGMHLHTTGRCEGPAFTTAGSHLNPEGRQHGHLNSAGAHLGDLPNITARGDGMASAIIPLTAPRSEFVRQLFDSDGTAIVIHAGPDDYRTDPSGNSGSRIACGAFIPEK